MNKFMEENLDMTVAELLPIMQDQIIINNKYLGIKTWNPKGFLRRKRQ